MSLITCLCAIVHISQPPSPPPPPVEPVQLAGHTWAYDQNPTDATLQWRIDHGWLTAAEIDAADVYLALPECNRIGEQGLVSINGGPWERYLAFDCADEERFGTRSRMRRENIVAEVDYYTAMRYRGCVCSVHVEMRPD